MINFSKEEIEYIKEEMQKVLDIWENGTKNQLKEYIDKECSGKCLDMVLMLSRNNWFLLNTVNKNDYINKEIVDYCYYGLNMWVWVDAYMDTKEEVFEYIPDVTYCKLFEKIIKDEDDDVELTINDTKFYYDPTELKITDDILEKLKWFPAEDLAYSIYLDETQGLVIY